MCKADTEVHTYFVASEVSAPAVWVHNTCEARVTGDRGVLREKVRVAPTPVTSTSGVWQAGYLSRLRCRTRRRDSANGIFLPRGSRFAQPPMITHSRIHTSRASCLTSFGKESECD